MVVLKVKSFTCPPPSTSPSYPMPSRSPWEPSAIEQGALSLVGSMSTTEAVHVW